MEKSHPFSGATLRSHSPIHSRAPPCVAPKVSRPTENPGHPQRERGVVSSDFLPDSFTNVPGLETTSFSSPTTPDPYFDSPPSISPPLPKSSTSTNRHTSSSASDIRLPTVPLLFSSKLRHRHVNLPLTQLDSSSFSPLSPMSQDSPLSPMSQDLPLSPMFQDLPLGPTSQTSVLQPNPFTSTLPTSSTTPPHSLVAGPTTVRSRSKITKDYRGGPPPFKRWCLYCFRRVFVLEPNIPHSGIRFNAQKLLPLIQIERHADIDRMCEVEDSDDMLQFTESGSSSSSLDLPQLIIYRVSDVIAEVPNGTHQLYKTFGPLQQLFLIDCLIGQVHIADARFLAVVAESEAVAGICSASLQPSLSPPKSCQGDLDSFIYRIQRAWLIPYHLSLDRINLRHSSIPSVSSVGPMGLYYDDSSLYSRRPSRRQSKLQRRSVLKRQRSNGQIRLNTNNGSEGNITSLRNENVLQNPPSTESTNGSIQQESLTLKESHAVPIDSLRESHSTPDTDSADTEGALSGKKIEKKSLRSTFPISNVGWEFNGFGDTQFNNLLGEKLTVYKQGIEKLLATSFYYSYEIEITQTLQRKSHLQLNFSHQGFPCNFIAPNNRSRDRWGRKEGNTPEISHIDSHIKARVNLRDDLLKNSAATTESSVFLSGTASSPDHQSAIDPISYMNDADERFVWNAELYHPFSAWNIDPRWFTPVMQGSVTSATLTCGIHGLELILICRRSCKRAGTRYNHRGLDDAGNVANFNESEQLVSACRVDPLTGLIINRGYNVAGGGWASFVQIRGSVPVFWEQNATIAINPTPQLTRELDFAWKPFALHQKNLSDLYGDVTYVNLLSMGRGGESRLSKGLEKMLSVWTRTIEKMKSSGSSSIVSPPSVLGREGEESSSVDTMIEGYSYHTVRHVMWDFHHQIKTHGFERALADVVRSLGSDLQSFGYYCDKPHFGGNSDNSGYQHQTGVIRTNCLDCLDRTNAFQWYLCWSWLVHYLQQRGLKSFIAAGFRISETITPRSFFFESGQSVESFNQPLRLDSHHNARSFDSQKTRIHKRGIVVGHAGAPSETTANVHVRSSRRSRGRSSVTSMGYQSTFDESSEIHPLGMSAVRTVVVRCFGGDEGSVTFTYRSKASTSPGQLNTHPFRSQMEAPTALGLPTPVSLEARLDNREQEIKEGSIAGEYFPNVLKDVVARMWADHGDHISRAYTGTGSVLSGLVRQGKSSLATNMGHVMTSLGRFYQNTFEDAGRQDAIELLLNQHGRLSLPYITKLAEEARQKETRQPTSTVEIRKREQSIHEPLKDTAVTTEPSQATTPLAGSPIFTPMTSCPPPITGTEQSIGSLCVWYGTWNLGGRRINEPLENWLIPDASELPPADLYVIAIQELVELTGMRILLSQNDRDKEWQLELNIKNALGPSFQMLRSHSLVGLYIAVFVRIHIKSLVSQVGISDVKLGFKGQMGNKGAVLMRLRIGATSLCFINVHLSPGPDKSQQRRSQLQAVLDSSFQGRGNYTVRSHDCILIGGDFNFRCDVELQQVEDWLENGLWKQLLRRDQFETCKRLGIPPFRELQEAPINFLPTYKFRRGTNFYDKGRSPAWCDRIFYSGEYTRCSVTRNWISCKSYNRLDEFLSSDHKPIYGIYQVAIQFDAQSTPVHRPLYQSPQEQVQDSDNLTPQQRWAIRESRNWILTEPGQPGNESYINNDESHMSSGHDVLQSHLSPTSPAPSLIAMGERPSEGLDSVGLNHGVNNLSSIYPQQHRNSQRNSAPLPSLATFLPITESPRSSPASPTDPLLLSMSQASNDENPTSISTSPSTYTFPPYPALSNLQPGSGFAQLLEYSDPEARPSACRASFIQPDHSTQQQPHYSTDSLLDDFEILDNSYNTIPSPQNKSNSHTPSLLD